MKPKFQLPAYESPGGIAGGSGGGGPISGAAPGSIGAGDGGSGGGGTPQHIDISHDSYVKVPGVDKPVKFGEYIGGYVSKADFTRAQQKAAAEAQSAKQALQEQENRFRQAASQIMGRLGQGDRKADPNSLETTLSQLETREYVDGRTAAGIVRNLVQSSVMPLAQAIQQRDKALALMFQRLQALDGTVGTLRSRTAEGDIKSKVGTIKRALTGAGYGDDPVLDEMVQDYYSAYEGPDLDQELPNVIQGRLSALRNYFRALDKKEADEAKSKRLGLPGKGGSAAPGRPLRKGFQTPQQIADELWPGIQPSET